MPRAVLFVLLLLPAPLHGAAAPPRPQWLAVVAPDFIEAVEPLAAARRERLLDVQADWPADQRQRVADILQRLASELVPPRAA